jgi:HlyD family secretion protein
MKNHTWTRRAVVLLAGLGLAACQDSEAADEAPAIQTTQVIRGDLRLEAEATGTIEPIRSVEVKSLASGEILRLLADVGDEVEQGTLLAEVDPRDVRNAFDQAEADLEVARARVEITGAQLARSQQLLESQVITEQENEQTRLDHANAQADLVRAETNYRLAELRLSDVDIRAPLGGTVIQRDVGQGQVIQSAAQNVSGGTTLFVMANLEDVRVRALVDETDMGEIRAGLPARVRVEAFPDRTFEGTVQKVEPQAVVEQNVTMFPVIVDLDNRAGLLKPGMNAEVTVLIDEATDVVMVPNNAVVQVSDIGPAAMALGLDMDQVDLPRMGRGGGGPPGARRPGGAPGGGPPAGGPPAGGAPGGADGTSATAPAAAAGDNGPADGDARARIQELRVQAQRGEISRDSLRSAVQSLRATAGAPGASEDVPGLPPRETRPAAVFVMSEQGEPELRMVRVGINDWDHTQVVSGLEEGETLAVVGAAQLQAQQQEFLDRIRSRRGGGPF